MAVENNSGANQSKPCFNTIFQSGYLSMASDPLYAEDEMELTSSEINLPHNLDEMASSLEHDQIQYVMHKLNLERVRLKRITSFNATFLFYRNLCMLDHCGLEQ